MEEQDNPQKELEHRVREHLAFIYPSLDDGSYLSQLIAEMSLGAIYKSPNLIITTGTKLTIY